MRKLLLLVSTLIIFSLFFVNIANAETNLVKNPSFEEFSGSLVINWNFDPYMKDPSYSKSTIESGNAHTGNSFVTIENMKTNDARFKQSIVVKKNTTYKLSCWAKTENVGISQNGKGACISIDNKLETSNDLKGTNSEWQLLEMYVATFSQESFIVTVGIGGYGSDNIGKASFDDVKVEEVTSVPSGAVLASLGEEPSSSNNVQSTTEQSKVEQIPEVTGPGNIFWVILILGIVVLIGGIIYYLIISGTILNKSKLVASSDSSDSELLSGNTSVQKKETKEFKNEDLL
jgi:dolichyl-phosphate-mannose-protein mannosyltransferase